MMQQFKSRQFLVFLLTGGFAAAVNFSSRILFNQWVSYSVAVFLAYITGMITAFALAKIFVFKGTKQDVMHSTMWFILINLLAVAQTWGISMALVYYVLPALHIKKFIHEISHAVGVMIPVFTSYLGHKHFSFK